MAKENRGSGKYVTAGTGFADVSARPGVIESPRWSGLNLQPREVPLSDPNLGEFPERLENEKKKGEIKRPNNEVSLLPRVEETNELQNDLSPSPTTPSTSFNPSPKPAPDNSDELKRKQEQQLKNTQQPDNRSVNAYKSPQLQPRNTVREDVESKRAKVQEELKAGGVRNILTMSRSLDSGQGRRYNIYAEHWGVSEQTMGLSHAHIQMSAKHQAMELKMDEKQDALKHKFQEHDQALKDTLKEHQEERNHKLEGDQEERLEAIREKMREFSDAGLDINVLETNYKSPTLGG